MADITFGNGGTTFTGKGIDGFRLAALKGALSLEAKGMKMSRGRSALSVAKGMGFKARTAKDAIPLVQAALDEIKGKLTVKTSNDK